MNEIRTYQTRLALSCEQAALLDAYAALYGKAVRSLFALSLIHISEPTRPY